MMVRTLIAAVCISAIAAAAAAQPQGAAQPRAARGAQPPAPTVAPPPPPPAPAPPGVPSKKQPVNIRVDVTITEQGGSGTVKRTASLVTGDGLSGSIRSV